MNLITVLLEQKHGQRLPCVQCRHWFFPYELGVLYWHSGECKACDKGNCIKGYKPHLVCRDCEQEMEYNPCCYSEDE